MLRISCAPSVSGPHCLVTGFIGIDNDTSDRGYPFHKGRIGQDGLLDADRFGDLRLDYIQCIHNELISFNKSCMQVSNL